MNRLRELDFLRGIAILLVLLRHQPLSTFTTKMGWIGVDLFFVLSGFLVSGLLFKEYKKFGDIRPKLFLIRRGFKIYPIYYLFYLIYLIPILVTGDLNLKYFFSEIVFVQNYVSGWGYAFQPSWSLAIEEHFYFGFSLLLAASLKSKKIRLYNPEKPSSSLNQFEKLAITIMIVCLILRIANNAIFPSKVSFNFAMTHLRIDSLIAGTLISYLYHFKESNLKSLFKSNKVLLSSIAVLGIGWTPFIEPITSFFAKTVGFSLVYISFGIILIYFLVTKEINKIINSIFSRQLVNIISKIGFCSYSIYIIHSFVNMVLYKINLSYGHFTNSYFAFFVSTFLSIVIGAMMTYWIENYFLTQRNKYFPNRAL